MSIQTTINDLIKKNHYTLIKAAPTTANNRHYEIIIEVNRDDMIDPLAFTHYCGRSDPIREFISDDENLYKYMVIRNIEKIDNNYRIALEAYDYQKK